VLLIEVGRAPGPPEDKRFNPAGREVGPLIVLLAPSPNPTRLALPSSLTLLTLEVPSSGSWSSLILSASNASLPLAQVVRPPMLPVALALPTVLRSFRAWLSKYPGAYEVGALDWPPARAVATRSRPARREMRSARSASKVVVEDVEAEDWCAWWPWEKGWPW
jgi:hypothetical protein